MDKLSNFVTLRCREMGEGVGDSAPSWAAGRMMISWAVVARSHRLKRQEAISPPQLQSSSSNQCSTSEVQKVNHVGKSYTCFILTTEAICNPYLYRHCLKITSDAKFWVTCKMPTSRQTLPLLVILKIKLLQCVFPINW